MENFNLFQPEPKSVRPSDEAIVEQVRAWGIKDVLISDVLLVARSVLSRWGLPSIPPEPAPQEATGLLHSDCKHGPWEPLGKGEKPKRYCRGFPQPESDEVTSAEIYRLIEEVDQKGLARPGLVRAALARWGRPAIQPIPVTERLPEVGGEYSEGPLSEFSDGGMPLG